jgi:hypothetical protein
VLWRLQHLVPNLLHYQLTMQLFVLLLLRPMHRLAMIFVVHYLHLVLLYQHHSMPIESYQKYAYGYFGLRYYYLIAYLETNVLIHHQVPVVMVLLVQDCHRLRHYFYMLFSIL